MSLWPDPALELTLHRKAVKKKGGNSGGARAVCPLQGKSVRGLREELPVSWGSGFWMEAEIS